MQVKKRIQVKFNSLHAEKFLMILLSLLTFYEINSKIVIQSCSGSKQFAKVISRCQMSPPASKESQRVNRKGHHINHISGPQIRVRN